MRSHMNKIVCTLWGHSFVFSPSSPEFIRGGHEAHCRRCGQERFQTHSSEVFPDIPRNDVRESLVNFRDQGRTLSAELRQ